MVTTFFPVSCLIEAVSSYIDLAAENSCFPVSYYKFCAQIGFRMRNENGPLVAKSRWDFRAEMGLEGGFKRREYSANVPVFLGSRGNAHSSKKGESHFVTRSARTNAGDANEGKKQSRRYWILGCFGSMSPSPSASLKQPVLPAVVHDHRPYSDSPSCNGLC